MDQFTKVIDTSKQKLLLNQRRWLLEETMHLKDLTICERAEILAPDGKVVTLIQDGIVRDLKPGHYLGEITLYVSEPTDSKPEGLMFVNQIVSPVVPAICIKDGKLVPEKSVAPAVWGGTYSDTEADGIYMAIDSERFNGIVVDGGDYTVKNSRFDIEGFATNDFAGIGSGIMAVGDSHVTIEDCEINVTGVTRTALHVAGDSRVTVRNTDITNLVPYTGWPGTFSWQVGFSGSHRLTQLAANGQVLYENCRLKSNGWGVCSIDGSDIFVKMVVKDSKLTLTGPNSHGYGVFCIGPNEVDVDHSVLDVFGYPVLVQGMERMGLVNITNGSVLKGRRFGVMCFSDDGSDINASDSTFDTGNSNFIVKSACPIINLDNCTMKAGNGVLLQMMDTDEAGMDQEVFYVPVGVEDVPIEGLDLTSVVPKKDVVINLSNMSVEGDLYNSSSNIRAYLNSRRGGMGEYHDTLIGAFEPGAMPEPPEDADAPKPADPEERRGPQNLGVYLKSASVKGVISSATQAYRDGVTQITVENQYDMSNVTQTAAPTVNNGVVVELDSESTWTVTGTSYITGLLIAEGAAVCGADGKHVSMTVDGVQTQIRTGRYSGKIVLSLQ